MNEPKRHHYIPQFILKNFCYDDKGHFYYYDISTGRAIKSDKKQVFMSKFLYSVDADTPEDRARIERDFGTFEREVSEIIAPRFLEDKIIVISAEENEKLLLFFALMGFRSINTHNFFSGKMSRENRDFYMQYQKDGNFNSLWKRNIGILVNCRSMQEIIDNPDIDSPIKNFMKRDVLYASGRYFSVVECPDSCEFVISDTYPTVVTGYLPDETPLEMYAIFPFSSKRAILMCCNGVEDAPNEVRKLRKCIVLPPNLIDDRHIKIKAKRLNEEEVASINQMLIKDAKIGVASRSELTMYVEEGELK